MSSVNMLKAFIMVLSTWNFEYTKMIRFHYVGHPMSLFLPFQTIIKGDADHKSSYVYENLPVKTKMAILSRRLILLAILLYEQFLHLTQINLHPSTQLLSTQQHAYQSVFGYFLV